MSKTKIVVLKRRQVLITGLIALAAIAVVIIVVCLASGKQGDTSGIDEEQQSLYIPGVYNTVIALGDNNLNLRITLDKNNIKGLSIDTVDETVTVMYPLIAPSIKKIEDQLLNGVHIEDISLSEDSRYTQMLILDAVEDLLKLTEENE